MTTYHIHIVIEGTDIQYAVGDLDVAPSDTRRWTSLVTMTTPPKPGTTGGGDGEELMFLAFGDMGQAPLYVLVSIYRTSRIVLFIEPQG